MTLPQLPPAPKKKQLPHLRLHVPWKQRCREILVQNSHVILFQSTPRPSVRERNTGHVCAAVQITHFPLTKTQAKNTKLR